MESCLSHPNDDAPLELRLDLLVDGELGEYQRTQLLSLLDREPEKWRTLAVRFLQRQTEKESVRKLMAGGTLLPAQARPRQTWVIGRIGMRRFVATAAGLFIAAGSALVTLYATRAPARAGEFHTSLPAVAVESDRSVPVSVPIVKAADDSQFIPAALNRSTRNSFVVQPDGNGGAIVIPVSTVKAPVY
jgi:hypothetical protein